MSLIDSHCHIDDSQFEADRHEVIERATDAGVSAILAIGTGEGPPDLEAAIRLADRYESVYATIGIHPQYASQATTADLKRVEDLYAHPKVIGMGEVGLDYHWEPFDKVRQAAFFVDQMQIARNAGLPLIVHTRDAWTDTFALLRTHWASSGLPCILHCFTGGPDEVRLANELRCYVSFSGVLTYKNAVDVQQAAKLVPGDRLLVETDAPYLAPVPNRGQRNEPAFVTHIARRLAGLRDTTFESICSVTSANFCQAFRSASERMNHDVRT